MEAAVNVQNQVRVKLVEDDFTNEMTHKLAKRAASGDRAAFDQLLASHIDLFYRAAFKKLGTQDAAQEVLQEACLKIARNIHKFRFESSFSTWGYRIVLNAAHDWLRAKQKTDHAPLAPYFATDDNPQAQAELADLWRAVSSLPPPKDDVMRLIFSEGFSQKETAEILTMKEGTVAWHVSEAKKLLKQRLNPEDERHG